MQPQHFEGEWWVPGSKHKLYGTLTWNPGALAELDLLGRLSPPDLLPDLRLSEAPPTILGTTRSGERLTLTGTTILNSEIGFTSGRARERIGASFTFVGRHLEAGDETAIREVTIRSPQLQQWLGTHPFREIPTDGGSTDLQVRYSPRQTMEVRLPDGLLRVRTVVEQAAATSSLHLDAVTELDVRRGEPASLGTYWARSVGPALGLLSFATHSSAQLSALYVMLTDDPDERPVLVLAADVDAEDEEVPFRPDAMPLGRYVRGAVDIDALMRRWFTTAPPSLGARDLFTALLGSQSLYGEEHFLMLMSAVEAFWRSELRHGEIDEDDHVRRVSEVLASAPPEHRAWLAERLQYGNEPAQIKRLEEVCDHSGVDLKALAGDPKKFLRSVVNTRNYLVHLDPSGESRAERDPIRLYWISRILSLVVEFSLLAQLEVAAAERREIQRHYRIYGAAIRQSVRSPLF